LRSCRPGPRVGVAHVPPSGHRRRWRRNPGPHPSRSCVRAEEGASAHPWVCIECRSHSKTKTQTRPRSCHRLQAIRVRAFRALDRDGHAGARDTAAPARRARAWRQPHARACVRPWRGAAGARRWNRRAVRKAKEPDGSLGSKRRLGWRRRWRAGRGGAQVLSVRGILGKGPAQGHAVALTWRQLTSNIKLKFNLKFSLADSEP
jgi:hypothetical protein